MDAKKPLREMTREELLGHARDAVPVNLQAIGMLDAPTLFGLTRYLDDDITRLARTVAYLDACAMGKTHAQAVRVSNVKVRQVRRILGYQITRDLNF